VSRSFAPSIAQLGQPLEEPVGIAYLLCRVVDTVEDTETLREAEREGLFGCFIAALSNAAEVPRLVRAAGRAFDGEPGHEAELMRDAEQLFEHYHELAVGVRDCMRPHIVEMAEGMGEYRRRPPDAHGLVVLDDQEDLFRYCHIVAGTVGGLLTELFLHFEAGIEGRALEERAESFGQGLQLVNIAKDLAGDHRRGAQFLPRSWCVGFEPHELLAPDRRPDVLAAHRRLCELAEGHLQRALEYTLLLPPASSARRFCALPLLLARATLRELRGNPDVLDPDRSVKVDRAETLELITFVAGRVSDGEALEELYGRLGSKDRSP
jgi:farnesyl-diphosphate farnesyltransferase